MNLYEYTASDLHEKLVNKEVSATEIAKDALDRINATEDKVGAFVTITEEVAMAQAKATDEKIAAGEKIGELAGIPIAIKDNICTNGIKTTCSSKMLMNFVPPYSATAYEKVLENSMTVVGKVNMDEFAMGSSCENSAVKPTHNPRNLDCVPGGSSGGSAAAVAAGQATLSLGTDTGGSIRQPAAFTGTIGLKPTYGSVSRYGLVAFASSLDQIGPIGRSVKDVASLYSAICGADKLDATSARREYPNFASLLNSDVKGLRIGIPKEYFGDGVEPEIKEAVMNAVKQLEKMGATIVNISLPSTDYALAAYYILSSAEASSNLARFDGVKYGFRAENYNGLNDMYEKTRSEGFGDEVKRRIMLGSFVLSSGYYDAHYSRAKLLQEQITAEFAEAFKLCDVLATPTAPTTAFKLGENMSDPMKMYAGDISTVTINIAGLPAISVPCGNVNGLPVGLQLIGAKFSEQTLLNTAYAYENSLGSLCSVANL